MPHQDAQRPMAGRRRLLQAMAIAGAAAVLPSVARRPCPGPWEEWRAFMDRHVQADGRVVDFDNDDLRSTSESQSYALFFALVDNDQVAFDRILAWTRRHLKAGRPDLNLPAWLWGRSADGRWGVLDANTASDGELWIGYALLEAGRLWDRPGLVAGGRQMLALMRAAEVADLPGLGPMLLPGAKGFVHEDRWTLNASYLPLFVLRRFAAEDPAGPWARLARNSVAVARGSAPAGFAPDWIAWNGRDFVIEPDRGAIGSYDAIRCYLWAGMTAPADPLRKELLEALSGPAAMLRAEGRFAEKVDTRVGVGTGTPPPGFAAALAPYLCAMGEGALAHAQLAQVPAPTAMGYYDRVLALFGRGWMDQRYRFSAEGRLHPAWSTPCS